MLKRFAIFVHRWLGVALCLIFLLWFPSGIAMMYWGYPDVSADDRLERAPALDRSKILLSPAEAYAKLDPDAPPPGQARLNMYDGRPAYRFRAGRSNAIVFADTGEERGDVSMDLVARIAAAWTSQPANSASVTAVTEVDQWTLQSNIGNLQPLWKYTWPNGEHVYVSQASGEVVQYTTTASRLGAYAGPITHWFYFTPLRKNGRQWSRVVIWSSGIATFAAILGLVVGVWMYSPRKRYRYDGAPTSHSVSRPETLAHGARADLRHRHCHVGVQRHAVDGTVPAAQRRRRRAPRGSRWTDSAIASRAPGLRSVLGERPARRAGPTRESPGQGTGAHVAGRTTGLHGDARRR